MNASGGLQMVRKNWKELAWEVMVLMAYQSPGNTVALLN